jgi:hypothetical protein
MRAIIPYHMRRRVPSRAIGAKTYRKKSFFAPLSLLITNKKL